MILTASQQLTASEVVSIEDLKVHLKVEMMMMVIMMIVMRMVMIEMTMMMITSMVMIMMVMKSMMLEMTHQHLRCILEVVVLRYVQLFKHLQ